MTDDQNLNNIDDKANGVSARHDLQRRMKRAQTTELLRQDHSRCINIARTRQLTSDAKCPRLSTMGVTPAITGENPS
jgi:hypothetical protein